MPAGDASSAGSAAKRPLPALAATGHPHWRYARWFQPALSAGSGIQARRRHGSGRPPFKFARQT